MRTRIGIIPLGQSPRPDFAAPIAQVVGARAEIVQCGALEGLTHDEIMSLDRQPGDYPMHTNLPPDGRLVTFPRRHVLARIPGVLKLFESQGVGIATICCTEPWPDYEFAGVLLQLRRLVDDTVAPLNVKGKGLVLFHPMDPPEGVANRWKNAADLTFRPLFPSPTDEELNALAELAPDFVVLDCVTYSPLLKERIRKRLTCPVVLPLAVLSNAIEELICA